MILVRNPNGYGSILKLSGNRRKPFGVRLTNGWDDEGKQLYKYLGYYKTRPEAMIALAEYNKNPYDLDSGKITFKELYEKFSEDKYPKLSKSNINGYKAAYKACESLYDMRFIDLRKSHLQGVVDSCGKNYPTLRKIRVFFNQMFKYAMENDLVSKDYSDYVEILHHKKEDDNKRKPFSDTEIKKLWDNVERNEYVQIVLMLIYSGVRISELLDLKKENVYMDERYFDVIESKTDAGIRKVPISKRTLPFFQSWMNKNGSDYLLSTPDGEHFLYRNYYDAYWKPFMEQTGMAHRPHDTRHTTISMLAAKNVNQTIIKRIVGHSGAMSLTERVYTHFEIKQLLDAIDLL